MATEPVAEISRVRLSDFLNMLCQNTDKIKYTIVPEKFRPCDDNNKKAFQRPVSVVTTPDCGVLAVTDIKQGNVHTVRLHYPADVKIVVKNLNQPMSLVFVHGVAVLSETGNSRIVYHDYRGAMKLKINSMKKPEKFEFLKQNRLIEENSKLNDYNVKDLNTLIKTLSEKNSGQNKTIALMVNGNFNLVKPVGLASFEDLLFVSDSQLGIIYQVEVIVQQQKLVGNLQKAFALSAFLPDVVLASHMPYNICFLQGCIYFNDRSAEHGGIHKLCLENNTLDHIYGPHTGVFDLCSIDNKIYFTDTETRQVKCVVDDVAYVVAGSGDSAHKDGLSNTCSFIQPTGICCEGNSLFVVDTGTHSLSILSSIQPLDQYLSMLRRIQGAYKIHFNVLGYHDQTVKDAIESLEFASSFLAKQVEDAKVLQSLNMQCLQGPQGVPASKTIQSVCLLKQQLLDVQQLVTDINIDYLQYIDLRSFLTLVNENLHGILRMRNFTPTVLDCAQEFIPAVQETIKKQTSCGYTYVTSEKKKTHYEIPVGLASFSNFPKFARSKPPKISSENLQSLLQYRNQYGKCVRQRNVRSDNTKDSAGTMPLYVYTHAPVTTYQSFDFDDIINSGGAEQPISTEKALYCKGQVVLMRGETDIMLGIFMTDHFVTKEMGQMNTFSNSVEDCLHFVNTGVINVVTEQILLHIETLNFKDATPLVIDISDESYTEYREIYRNEIDNSVDEEIANILQEQAEEQELEEPSRKKRDGRKKRKQPEKENAVNPNHASDKREPTGRNRKKPKRLDDYINLEDFVD